MICRNKRKRGNIGNIQKNTLNTGSAIHPEIQLKDTIQSSSSLKRRFYRLFMFKPFIQRISGISNEICVNFRPFYGSEKF